MSSNKLHEDIAVTAATYPFNARVLYGCCSFKFLFFKLNKISNNNYNNIHGKKHRKSDLTATTATTATKVTTTATTATIFLIPGVNKFNGARVIETCSIKKCKLFL